MERKDFEAFERELGKDLQLEHIYLNKFSVEGQNDAFKFADDAFGTECKRYQFKGDVHIDHVYDSIINFCEFQQGHFNTVYPRRIASVINTDKADMVQLQVVVRTE